MKLLEIILDLAVIAADIALIIYIIKGEKE